MPCAKKARKGVTILAEITDPEDYEYVALPLHGMEWNTFGSQVIHWGISCYSLPNSDSKPSSTDPTAWEVHGDQRTGTFRNEGLDYLIR